jgi:starvation-inducible DNA-binding protein
VNQKVQETPMMRAKEVADIGLTESSKQIVVNVLNALLADEYLLYTKTRNYHWNVTGARFHDLHKFFEEQYEKLDEVIDEIAETARQFGGYATGTMAEYIQTSHLQESPGEPPDDDGMIRALLHDHESIVRNLRPAVDRIAAELKATDAADFLTGILEAHNKMAWMLRSFLTT